MTNVKKPVATATTSEQNAAELPADLQALLAGIHDGRFGGYSDSPKLTRKEIWQIEGILKSRGGLQQFREFLGVCEEGTIGGYDFDLNRSLPTTLAVFGPEAFENRITGLTEEQSTGNAMLTGQEVMDGGPYLLKNNGLVKDGVEDVECVAHAVNSMYIGIALEFWLSQHPKLVKELHQRAQAFGGVLINHNYTPSQPLEEAHAEATDAFHFLVDSMHSVLITAGGDFAESAANMASYIAVKTEEARKERRRAMNNASRAARKAKAKLAA